MNLLFDLKEILYDNNDTEHELRISVDPYEVKVELIYQEMTKDAYEICIPIVYNLAMGFAYIPDDEYREKYIVEDYGITCSETKIIYDIMSYLEMHGQEICAFCDMLGLDGRQEAIRIRKENG